MRGSGCVGALIAALAVVLVAATALVVASPPASAAFEIRDVAGDATGLDPLPPPAPFVVESTPRPSEDEFDILSTSITSDGTRIGFVLKMAKVGPAAIPSVGASFRVWFTYDAADYQVIVQRADGAATNVSTTGVFLRARDPQSVELSCRDCNARYDVSKGTISVSLPYAGLSSGIRQSKPSSPRLAKGAAKLSGLMVLSQRLVLTADRSVDAGRTLTVDVARGEALVLVL